MKKNQICVLQSAIGSVREKNRAKEEERGGARSEMVLVDRSFVIKGREYKSPYDWCQLNNHHASKRLGGWSREEGRVLPLKGRDGLQKLFVDV